ncbi:Uncharacterized protein ALO70_01980 [Pseudomonas amygdali pv. eriobotryae]|uniref:Uncharacterized protein n=1 Tax=Pseudomonas amygdali pv. eriobotryae TaxID=129137 RepID=A0A0P9PRM0_PSEA0|nr:hypothetical protein [Pseudomonas amygdali]KPX23296.1 Uncharacterized protein ALO70_01980 [Pseudomonas amygdali pv. eriobotryae]RML98494.1 hypothetical protein ALQ86_00052 [Pseudomonas amygdali pv. eriobotryae]RMO56791.1 hypothetical protein ALQ39_00572 [Pseudomonas amygdali pv. eriobotryae]GFZ71550.1 hypothetical protein PSE10C_22920 [Pseudomonas amygdali pv. eriobotryae]
MTVNGTNSFGRLMRHLDQGDFAKSEKPLALVEDLFGKEWLSTNGGHRLQKLWARKDTLSSTELFALGRAIEILTPDHSIWLKRVANDIIRQPKNAHGYIAEIMVCASLSTSDSTVLPASKGNKGFNLTLTMPSQFKYLISIKNHDISEHEALFREKCATLKAAFAKKMKELKVHGALRIASSQFIELTSLDSLVSWVSKDLKKTGSYEWQGGGVKVLFSGLLAKGFFSSELVVFGGFHRNELANQKSRIIQAAENLKKHVPPSPNAFRFVWMRVQSSADVALISDVAKELIEHGVSGDDVGVDGFIIVQPSVVREGDSSMVNTVFSIVEAPHAGLQASRKQAENISIDVLVGGVSSEASRELLQVDGNILELPPHQYVYQDSDFYILSKMENGVATGNVSSPASGVRNHSVFDIGGQEMGLTGRLSPRAEELLIF